MLSLNLLLKFLLNVFIFISYQTVFTVSAAHFIHVYVEANKMSPVQTEKWKEDDI